MPALGLRGRIFVLSVFGIIACGAPAALYLEHQLRTWLVQRLEHNLERQAQLTARAVWQTEGKVALDALDPQVDALGHAASVRLTVVSEDGTVMADSKVPTQQLARLESHAERPEIIAARMRGQGKALRYSQTLRTDMLYVAVRAPEGAIVRAAVPLSDVDAVMRSLHLFMVVSGLLALGLALGMTFIASRLMSEPIRRLLLRTQPLLEDKPPIELSDSMSVMATQLDSAVAALARERDRLAAILNALTDGVVVLGPEGEVKSTNPVALEILGRDALQAGDLEPFQGALDAPIETQVDGRTVMARAAALNFGGQVLVLHDVTSRRRLENMRKDFIANVSHELRTPVSILRANAETLLDRGLEDPEHGRGFAEAILRHAERLGRLISDLLDLSRLEAGRVRLWMQPVVLPDAAEVARAALAEKAEAKKVRVFIESSGTVSAFADAKGVDQILYNLLDNAIKHAPEDGRVDVRISAENKRTRLTVEDDGPGIPQEHRERIFERFYRTDTARSRDKGGTGLGLAIVRHWAEVLGGSVGVDEASSGGAQFWLNLPEAASSSKPHRAAPPDATTNPPPG